VKLHNRVAAVTGAAGGIGRAVAVQLADRGADVAVSDIDEEGLAETADLVVDRGAEVHRSVVDVADREAVQGWADEVVEQFDDVHLIVNNAGVSVSASVEGLSYEDLDWIMDINFRGVVHGTKAFLPYIRRAGEGRVVNVSSVFGLIASPTQSAYNASKFAVRGFTESLRAELALDDAAIGASTVHPGGIDTDIVRNSRVGDTGIADRSREEVVQEFEKEIARLSPDEAAEIIVDGIRRENGRILVGVDAKLLDIMQRIVPGSYPEPLARIIRMRWNSG
jgi:NAD(P)-dependent dehydrogenase (short-subunit alcohol dehydrogenase family)